MDGLFDQRRYLIPFRSGLLPQIFTDTLVIGAGVAGLRAAIAASAHGEVIILAKGDLKNTNTAWAQGGIAGVLGGPSLRDEGDDTVEAHAQDTLTAGAGTCDAAIVKLVTERGPGLIDELIGWGMNIDRDGAKPALGREGGHSAPRIVHAGGDATGRELQRVLLAKVRSIPAPTIRLFEKCFALDLITPTAEPGAPVMGAITHHPKHGLQMIWAKATILATGGAGVLYRETTNPPLATADGLAMAYRAGATLADMAYVQFHPTTLYLAGASRALITEAIRGHGAYLLDASGQRFMKDVHPLAELAPRDIVSHEIVRQIARQGGGNVFLDCRHITDFAARFPEIAALLKRFDLNPKTDLIPVHPAAHYMVGGVKTDRSARTDVPGLYAAGECTCTGLHGANRLASNSLLEGLVFGEVAGRTCAEMKLPGGAGGVSTSAERPPGWAGSTQRHAPVPIISDIRPSDRGELDLTDVRSSLRSAMWKNVGIERNEPRLSGVIEMIDFWARYTLDKIFDDPVGWETQNLLLVGAAVARSAAWREESRGCHFRSDFPEPRPEFAVHDCWKRGKGKVTVTPIGGHQLAASTR
jgi:L-aspartate oxidase